MERAYLTPIDRFKRIAAGLPQRYTYKSAIGRGAAAFVVLADDLERNAEVAIKILRPEVATFVGEKRFRREIEILSNLEHPNIRPFLDHGITATGSLYLVTPYVAGETLRTRLQREKRLAVRDAIGIATDVASALDYAHARALMHRDIKPANILLAEGRVIVADFGISRATAVEGLAQITMSGVSLGTPEYMSPEQISGASQLDGRCDIYALGCVVYEMLTGKPPFTGSTSQIFLKHRNEAPRPIGETRADVPIGIDAAVMRSLAKVRASRFRKAGEFAEAMMASG